MKENTAVLASAHQRNLGGKRHGALKFVSDSVYNVWRDRDRQTEKMQVRKQMGYNM